MSTTLYPPQEYGVLGPLPPGWVNVQDFGADPSGNDPASLIVQDAINETPDDGGVLLFPPGIYKFDRSVFLKSNITVWMYGATLKATPLAEWQLASPSQTRFWANTYYFFGNENADADEITDENIAVWGGTFDYRLLTSAPGGGRHAIHFRMVRNVKVGYGTLYAGEDYTAFRSCDDTLVIGCSAFDFINCAYDHWAGARNARVIGCQTRSSEAVQHVNFNALGDGVVGQVASGFIMQGCQLEHPTGGSRAYGSVFLDPLGTGHTSKDMVLSGNILRNVIIPARGNVRNVIIQGNQFFGTPGAAAVSPILSYPDSGDTPDNIVVDNNVFHDPQTAAPNVAVIDVRATNSRITNNTITGASYSVPGYGFGSNIGIDFGNLVSTGSYGAPSSPSSGGRIKGANAQGLALLDSGGASVRWYVQADDNLVLYGVDAALNGRLAASWQQRSDSSAWDWAVEVRHSNNLLRTLGNNLTATGTLRTDALALTAQFNNMTTVASGTGVRLIDRPTGELIVRVRNGGANALNVYPFNGTDQIDALGAGNPYVLAAGDIGTWCLTTAGQWYTVGVSP